MVETRVWLLLNGLKRLNWFVICAAWRTLLVFCYSNWEETQQERKDVGCIRDALYIAFVTHPFIAYDQFIARCLNSNGSVDVYLADLHRLSTLYSGVSDHGLAFVAELPELCALSQMDLLDVNQLLDQARAILKDWYTGGRIDCGSCKAWANGYRLDFYQWSAEWYILLQMSMSWAK